MVDCMNKSGTRVRVAAVQPLDRFTARVTFENGVVRESDLQPYLHGPVFAPIRSDREAFCAMKVEGGTIAWENGADIDPDVLYYNLTPAWMEQEAAHTGTPG